MTPSVDLSATAPPGWDDRLAAAGPEAGFQQTRLWGELIVAMGLGETVYATVLDGARPLAMALFTIGHPPSRIGKLRAQIMCNEGPVILDADHAGSAVEALLKAIERRLLAWRLSDIRFEGLAKSSRFHGTDVLDAPFLARGYVNEPWGTYLLDVTGTDEELLARIGRKAREKVKRALRLDVALREVSDVDDFLANVNPVYAAGGVKTPVPEDRARLGFAAEAQRCYRYLLATDKSDGVALAVGGICVWGDIALRVSTSITPAARERRIPAQELLTWESLRLARAAGARLYDFAGVNPNPRSEKEIGIADFKAKWGGDKLIYSRWLGKSAALSRLDRWRERRVQG